MAHQRPEQSSALRQCSGVPKWATIGLLLLTAACASEQSSAGLPLASEPPSADAANCDEPVPIPAAAEVLASEWTEQLLLDSDNLYFVDGSSIRKLPLAGGAEVELASASCCLPATLALGASDVYFVEWGVEDSTGSHGFLRSVPIAGGAVTTLASEQSFPEHLVLDGDTLFWTTRNMNGAGGIQAFGLAGQSVSQIVSATGATALTAAGGYVYWGEWTGFKATRVLRVAVVGGTPELLGSFETEPVSLSVTADALYVALASTLNMDVTFDDGRIERIPLDGSPVDTIATSQRDPRTLAVDSTYVYWSTWGTLVPSGQDGRNGGVSRAPLAGGPVEPLAVLDAATALAIDNSYFYWSETCRDVGCRVIARMRK